MLHKSLLQILLVAVSPCGLLAAKVDTVNIFSTDISGPSKCVVIKPDSYSKHKKKMFPVVYLLHGYSGNYSDWINKVPEIKNYADDFNVMIVCPDGGYASWYFDSDLKMKSKYETYISKEVPAFIDANYRTDTSRSSRAITGLSMGGHGALYIAWRHPHKFGAAGSMSGGVDLTESVRRFEIESLIGEYTPAAWKNYSLVEMVGQPAILPLQITIDCGVGDFFIEGNRRLHKKLLEKNIPHEYIERDGAHTWNYWKYSIHYQLLFFKKYFDQHK